MRLFSLAFLCGIIFLQFFSTLPDIRILIPISIISILALRFSKILAGFMFGFAWVLFYAHLQLSWSLPQILEGKTIQAIGTVASIPERNQQRTRFLFQLEKINNQSAKGYVRLSWNEEVKLLAGEKWQLPLRLKRVHGLQNPGGFDYEAWSLQQGIRAQGYVVKNEKKFKLSDKYFSINRMRQFFYEKIKENLPQSHTSPWIIALAIGERHGIPAESWKVLRNTGTNHLMAIAGLHIGFMSLFVYGLVGFFWRFMPNLILKLPVLHAAGIAAAIMTLIYSAMAGFSIPTQRACIMFFVFLTFVIFRRQTLGWNALCVALLFVLLLNPLSVLSESFWLSFGSVALIIYGMNGRLAPSGLWWKFGRIQWVVAVGLIPIGIWLFQQCSLLSFIANSIAIPCVGLLVLPLTLLGSFLLLISGKWGGETLWLADKILQGVWFILEYLSNLSWASWHQFIPNTWVLMAASLGMVILLFPIGFPGRWFGILWILPLIFYQAPSVKINDFWFTLLDVGQGLSAVIQTANHTLVYDTGAKLSDSYDMGESVVLPFLRTIGAKKIDMLVVSHGDNDHSGGAHSILNQLPVTTIKTSVPEKFALSLPCLKGESWRWEGVDFQFLYPSNSQLGLGNDSSCVLKVSNKKYSILLTGDIEKLAEQYLIQENTDLAADILVAPHHGSKTSALDEFVKRVSPKFILYPIGYRNRYHFPHPSVQDKYEIIGAHPFDTAQYGAIQFKIDEHSHLQPELYRIMHQKYWHQK